MEDSAHMGASRHGGTRSTRHAYSEAEGRDHKHVGVVSDNRDQGSRTGVDMSMSMSMSTSMGSDGGKGMSMGNEDGHGQTCGNGGFCTMHRQGSAEAGPQGAFGKRRKRPFDECPGAQGARQK